MKMTPTKDKQLKPIFHVVELIGAGYVSYVAPDLLKLQLGEMLRKAITHISPTGEASQRALLTFFIDRGYLELCQAQNEKVTNLIQIMDGMGVKYLGTIKDSKSFPFQIVNLNDPSMPVVNGRPSIQGYGTRTSFLARSGSGDVISTVMIQGARKYVVLELLQT